MLGGTAPYIVVKSGPASVRVALHVGGVQGTTVGRVKEVAAPNINLPREQLQLRFGGRILEDEEKSLWDYGVKVIVCHRVRQLRPRSPHHPGPS